MRSDAANETITLEAPGDFLSGLLAVCGAELVPLRAGGLCAPKPERGCWRLFFPLEGFARLTAGEMAWTLEPGQAVALPGKEEAALLAAGDCRAGLLTLCGAAADAVFADCREGLFFETGGHAAGRLLRRLSVRCTAKEASAAAYELLMELHGAGTARPGGHGRLPPVVEAALGLIRRDFAFLEGVAELARRLEVSQEYLTRVFLKYTGVTPGRYLTRTRIENARLLLRQGGHSVQFVSDACGFSNANYFARVFRAAVGMNPRDYARQSSGGAEKSADEDLYVL